MFIRWISFIMNPKKHATAQLRVVCCVSKLMRNLRTGRISLISCCPSKTLNVCTKKVSLLVTNWGTRAFITIIHSWNSDCGCNVENNGASVRVLMDEHQLHLEQKYTKLSDKNYSLAFTRSHLDHHPAIRRRDVMTNIRLVRSISLI